MPEISVVIPLFDKQESIARAIDSALRQPVDAEVVVVDDGSSDNSAEVVQSYARRVRYFHQSNAGPSAARNRGIEEATAPAVVFLDADDELLDGCLEAHLACRAARPDVDFSFSPFRVVVPNPPGPDRVYMEELIHDRFEQLQSVREFRFYDGFHYDLVRRIVSGSICASRELSLAIGGFDTRLHCWEVSDFLFRGLVRSPKAGILDQVRVLIHGNLTGGQFARARSRTGDRVVQAHNFLDHVAQVPREHQGPIRNAVSGCMTELLLNGDFGELRRMNQRVPGHWQEAPGRPPILRLARWPRPLLDLARWAVRLKQRSRGSQSLEDHGAGNLSESSEVTPGAPC